MTACADCAATADAGALPFPLGDTCPQVQGSTPCSICMHNHCCETQAACNHDPECLGFAKCEANCTRAGGTHDPCVLQCDQTYPHGLIEEAPFLTCALYYCVHLDSSCGSIDPCGDCSISSCRDLFMAVWATRDGYLIESCIGVQGGLSPASVDTCGKQYPSARDALVALNNCIQASCGTACP
jgi:hypothetical protein